MASKTCVVHPIISPVQKIILYKTKSRFYLVGSNNTQDKFRVLKIDRTETRELNVIDDKVEYSRKEIKQLLNMIEHGNVTRQGQKYVSDLNRTISSFGIVGFIKFLEGYYIILITKRKRVAIIGHHTIYKIQDTCMVYIPNDGEKSMHPHETKYLKLFQSMDLSSNFYFSYSYDISHTLQYNLAPMKELAFLNVSQESEQMKTAPIWKPQVNSIGEATEEVAIDFLDSLRSHENTLSKTSSSQDLNVSTTSSESGLWSEMKSADDFAPSTNESCAVHYGIRTKPHWRFVWNSFLLEPVDLHSDWLLYITHGFVGQSNINIYGRSIYLTLIARRSQHFAGTRFLKRGASDKGDVANEVETEQIVFDSTVSSLNTGNFTSFVQLRGSIPSQWSQDISKMVPKPPIMLDNVDPFCFVAGQHFNNLLGRYGSPLVILNLVKKREQRRHESILCEEYSNTIEYLNQFLPPSQKLINIGFDMAHVNKLKEANVLPRLAQIAYYVISKIGIFHSKKEFYCQKIHSLKEKKSLGGYVAENEGRVQTGVVRVNCVDCLDRTNTAQFALGKVSLAFQLYVLGVLDSPTLEFDTDSVRILEELYEDHGDTLALQYGGSQLVHRVKTYRKIAPLSSHSRDIMQTLSRYYSNTFSDADKQNAINLFLGIYKPSKTNVPLWEMLNDYYLHNSIAAGNLLCHRNVYTCWWNDEVQKCLPLAYNEVSKEINASLLEIIKTHSLDPRIDGFFDHYRPFEMSTIMELLSFTMNHSIRDVMPNFSTDYSPFSIRVRPGRKIEYLGDKPPNPSVTGIPSTASASSGTSETDSGDSSSEEFVFLDSEQSLSSYSQSHIMTFENRFTSMQQVYGMEPKLPKDKDMRIYENYINIGKMAGVIDTSSLEQPKNPIQYCKLTKKSHFKNDSTISVVPPVIKRVDFDIYATYVERGIHGPTMPPQKSLSLYQSYCCSQFL